jgi:hypothetical protein
MVSLIVAGCAGPHVEVTRLIGLFPPNIENRSDFYDDAKKRCEDFEPKPSQTAAGSLQPSHPSTQCITYWEAVLWGQDYRDYVGARAVLNRNVIYWGGIIALASVGALAGLAAFGHTSSDAYKIIPIAGTFLGGLLGYSKNDALYEAYEAAGMKIDQALRAGEGKVAPQTPTAYGEAASALRRDVGSAIEELRQKKIEIVKFQSKSEADQFKAVHDAAAERELGLFRLNAVATDVTADPTKIIATLNSALDPQKVPSGELRLKLSDTESGNTFTLRVSAATGDDVTAEIPPDLLNHGPRTYRVEVQARNGDYTMRDSKTATLTFTKVRLDITVNGSGSVAYSDAGGKTVTCAPTCDTGLVPRNVVTNLTATPPAAGPATYTWNNAPACVANTSPCPVTPAEDMKVTITFP